jgi:ornithine cyclodeaminase
VAPTPGEAAEGADLIITVTASREPVLHADEVTDGALVIAVGSDGPDKQELEVELLGRADVVVVDSRLQCAERGELHHAVDTGTLHPDAAHVVELGAIVAGAHPGRSGDEQLIVCDLTGVGVQDVAAAALVLERAVTAGLGETLSI